MKREDVFALGSIVTGAVVAFAVTSGLSVMGSPATPDRAPAVGASVLEFGVALDWAGHPARTDDQWAGPEDASTGWHRPVHDHPIRP